MVWKYKKDVKGMLMLIRAVCVSFSKFCYRARFLVVYVVVLFGNLYYIVFFKSLIGNFIEIIIDFKFCNQNKSK